MCTMCGVLMGGGVWCVGGDGVWADVVGVVNVSRVCWMALLYVCGVCVCEMRGENGRE